MCLAKYHPLRTIRPSMNAAYRGTGDGGNSGQRGFYIGMHQNVRAPDMPDTISGAEMRKNGTPLSLAIALANAVLPQPGGPCSRTPRGGSTPSRAYTWYQHLLICSCAGINFASTTRSMRKASCADHLTMLHYPDACESRRFPAAHLWVLQRAHDELHDVVQHAVDAAQVRIGQPARRCATAVFSGQ